MSPLLYSSKHAKTTHFCISRPLLSLSEPKEGTMLFAFPVLVCGSNANRPNCINSNADILAQQQTKKRRKTTDYFSCKMNNQKEKLKEKIGIHEN
jgi:hypothetical protein